MIISVEEARNLIDDFKGWSNERIQRKLKSIEQTIRTYTNNNFQKRAYRKTANIVGGLFDCKEGVPFKVGDTVEVSGSGLNAVLLAVGFGKGKFSFSSFAWLISPPQEIIMSFTVTASGMRCLAIRFADVV
jgi:hypothetical protein